MAKKKKIVTEISPLLARQLMSQQYPKQEGTGDGSIIGFKIPFLLQYLIDSQFFPYGITASLQATRMSCKSMLVFEFGRFIKPYYGWLDYVVTEGKWSESLAYSVVGWGFEDREVIRPITVGSMDEMQDEVLAAVDRLEEIATKTVAGRKPLGWHNPVVVAMDSISGVNLADRNKRIEEAGFAGREFASEAGSLTNFFRLASNKMRNYPVVLLMVNHRKEDKAITQYASPTVRTPGGKHLGFQVTYDLALKSIGHQRRLDESPMGALVKEQSIIRIKCEKNSLGAHNRQVDVRVSWQDKIWPDPGDGRPRIMRFTKWHWDEALVTLIEQWLQNKPGYGDAGGATKRGVAGRAGRFAEFFDFHRINKKGIKYWSATLGMAESDAVPASVFGRYIEENEDAKHALRLAFGIKPGVDWNPIEDFVKFRPAYLAKAMKLDQAYMSNTAVDGFINEFVNLDPTSDDLAIDAANNNDAGDEDDDG